MHPFVATFLSVLIPLITPPQLSDNSWQKPPIEPARVKYFLELAHQKPQSFEFIHSKDGEDIQMKQCHLMTVMIFPDFVEFRELKPPSIAVPKARVYVYGDLHKAGYVEGARIDEVKDPGEADLSPQELEARKQEMTAELKANVSGLQEQFRTVVEYMINCVEKE